MNAVNLIAIVGILLLLPACRDTSDAAPEAPAPASAADTSATPAKAPAPASAADTSATPAEAPAPAAAAGAPAAAAEDESAVMADIESILGNADEYKAAFLDLQKAVAAGDKDAVAQMVLYPLEQAVDGTRTIRDAGQFVREYDRIVTPDVSSAIASQKFADVMVNKNGIMIGNGEAWLTGICEDDACETQSIMVSALQDTSDVDEQATNPEYRPNQE